MSPETSPTQKSQWPPKLRNGCYFHPSVVWHSFTPHHHLVSTRCSSLEISASLRPFVPGLSLTLRSINPVPSHLGMDQALGDAYDFVRPPLKSRPCTPSIAWSAQSLEYPKDSARLPLGVIFLNLVLRTSFYIGVMGSHFC